jgi:hypothetical protein
VTPASPRRRLASAAPSVIGPVDLPRWTREDTIGRMRAQYDYRRRRLSARAGEIEDDGYKERSLAYQRRRRRWRPGGTEGNEILTSAAAAVLIRLLAAEGITIVHMAATSRARRPSCEAYAEDVLRYRTASAAVV